MGIYWDHNRDMDNNQFCLSRLSPPRTVPLVSSGGNHQPGSQHLFGKEMFCHSNQLHSADGKLGKIAPNIVERDWDRMGISWDHYLIWISMLYPIVVTLNIFLDKWHQFTDQKKKDIWYFGYCVVSPTRNHCNRNICGLPPIIKYTVIQDFIVLKPMGRNAHTHILRIHICSMFGKCQESSHFGTI